MGPIRAVAVAVAVVLVAGTVVVVATRLVVVGTGRSVLPRGVASGIRAVRPLRIAARRTIVVATRRVAVASGLSVIVRTGRAVVVGASRAVTVGASRTIALVAAGPVIVGACGAVGLVRRASIAEGAAVVACDPVATGRTVVVRTRGALVIRPCGTVIVGAGRAVVVGPCGTVTLRARRTVVIRTCGTIIVRPCGTVTLRARRTVVIRTCGTILVRARRTVISLAGAIVAVVRADAAGLIAAGALGRVPALLLGRTLGVGTVAAVAGALAAGLSLRRLTGTPLGILVRGLLTVAGFEVLSAASGRLLVLGHGSSWVFRKANTPQTISTCGNPGRRRPGAFTDGGHERRSTHTIGPSRLTKPFFTRNHALSRADSTRVADAPERAPGRLKPKRAVR